MCFVCLLVCLFVCLFARLFVWLFVCLFVCLFACLFVCLSYLFVLGEGVNGMRAHSDGEHHCHGGVG